MLFFFFKQKTAYEMRISDWSSDVCSSDLDRLVVARHLDDALDHRAVEAQRRRGVHDGEEARLLDQLRRGEAVAEAHQLQRVEDARPPQRIGVEHLVGDRKSTRLNSSH